MSSLSHAEWVAATRREGQALAAAARLGLDVAVPSCPDWTVGRLLGHVGRVYRYATHVLDSRATGDPGRPAPPASGEDPIGYLLDGLDGVIGALGRVEPTTPVWNWSIQPQLAMFWSRRMAQESAVHRYDGQLAHDVTEPIDADLAADGISEVFDTILPRLFAHGPVDGLDGTMRLVATDAGTEWTAKFTPESVVVSRGPGHGELTVTATASDLLLLLWNRARRERLEVTGDRRLLDLWIAGVRF